MKFIVIETTNGIGNAAVARYESLEQAREALRRRMGWPDIYLGPGYTADDSTNQIWYDYRTPAESQADAADERTPRITRLVENTLL